jgi:hypothetical protein
VRGILPDALVTVVSVQWFGSEALELTYKNATGRVANELLYRHDEPQLQVVEHGRPWSFDEDGEAAASYRSRFDIAPTEQHLIISSEFERPGALGFGQSTDEG